MGPYCHFVEINLLSWQQWGLLEDFYRMFLVNDSIRCNSILILKVSFSDKRWQVGNLSPPLILWFHFMSPLYMCIFYEAFIALGLHAMPKLFLNFICLSQRAFYLNNIPLYILEGSFSFPLRPYHLVSDIKHIFKDNFMSVSFLNQKPADNSFISNKFQLAFVIVAKYLI